MRRSVALVLFLVHCSCRRSAAPSDERPAILAAPERVERTALTAPTFDGLALGAPASAFLARFGTPCDVDPIDRKQSRLYFWSGFAGCREQAPFGGGTTVVLIAKNGAPPDDQPVEIVAWFGGAWFDTRASVGIAIGETQSAVAAKLGAAVRDEERELRDVGAGREVEYPGDVHVLFADGRAIGIAVGRLAGGKERSSVLASGWAHHRRYARRSE
jgi:hypothetical protein